MGRKTGSKAVRLLEIYSRFNQGNVLNKAELARTFQVTEKSIQRDIEALRRFFSDRHLDQDVIYDARLRGYRLISTVPKGLTNSEILAVCKILLESRSLRADEMLPILDKLMDYAVPAENRRAVSALIANEKLHYIEPHHGKSVLDGLWKLGQAIQKQQVLEIKYERMKEPKLVMRRVQPVGLMFSEYYFYLTAFLEDKSTFDNPDDLFPTIYRVDRIREYRVLDEHFSIPYKDRFEEGEFRKRVQFMYGGKLQRIKFKYYGPSIEAVLDRLPTAVILNKDPDGWVIEAESFGTGIEMWIRSQGDLVKQITP